MDGWIDCGLTLGGTPIYERTNERTHARAHATQRNATQRNVTRARTHAGMRREQHARTHACVVNNTHTHPTDEDEESHRVIEADVMRTRRTLAFFKDDAVQEVMVKLLTFYCQRRGTAYTQVGWFDFPSA